MPSTERWKARLTLERIASWFNDDPSAIAAWRRDVLAAAASKLTRARQADDKSNRAFDALLVGMKEAYRVFVTARYPELVASQQTGRDREYYLKSRSLPTGIRFKHAFFRGEISLIFEKKWAALAEVWLVKNAPAETWLVPQGSELHLRLATDVMDPALAFEDQEDVVVHALDGIYRLIPIAEQIAALQGHRPAVQDTE